MKKRRYDVLLAGALLLGAALLWLLVRPGAAGGWVVVTRYGEEVGRYALSEDACVTIGTEECYNVLRIRGGCASVIEANCADHTCIRMGEISRRGETVICLPHELVIEVVGGDEPAFDALAG